MPIFFGNIHNKNDIYFEPKKMSFSPDPISLVLTCSENLHGLLNEIEKYINAFFFTHNFGTRQSKGFGSFYPFSKEGLIKTTFPTGYARFSLNISNHGQWNCFYKLFDSIDLFYKTIRSGINQNGVYLKSLMYFYALDDQEEYWDKRAIKQTFCHFFPNRSSDKGEIYYNNNESSSSGNKPFLYRDMLGLSSTQEWRAYKDTITKDYVPANNEDEGIDRFTSPLLVKPIFINGRFEVYLTPKTIPKKYYNAVFEIKSRSRRRSFKMKTPENFDLNDYLQYVTDNGITNWILEKLEKYSTISNKRGLDIVKTLTNIYQNIEYV